MPYIMDMDQLFLEIEKDLSSLHAATAELDTQGSAAVSQWLENWSGLEQFDLAQISVTA